MLNNARLDLFNFFFPDVEVFPKKVIQEEKCSAEFLKLN